jgi:bifunctional UDP-N-acetylglucosamine pyrophosphorylase / glucosamine-1-phosphate N-acetyltransferase
MTRDSVCAVILAAGQGKRMKSQKPKVLHEILGKTILQRIIDAVADCGAEVAHIIIGHEAEQVIEYLDQNQPKIGYKTHIQKPQLGTGHALQQAVPDLKNFRGTLLVTVGDAPLLTGKTLREFVRQHKHEQAVVSLLTTKVPDAKNYGRILRDEQGKVRRIVEHKDCTPEEREINEINPAIYCFEWPHIMDGLEGLKNDNNQKEYYLTDLVAWAAQENLAMSSMVAEDWREVAGINSRLELAEACRLMRDRKIDELSLEEGVTIVDPSSTWIAPEVTIGEDTVILPGCYLMGKVEIDKNCVIGPHTVMNGSVRVGPRTTVAQSLVVNSEIGAECKVGPYSHLRENTKILDGCRVGNFVEIKKSEVRWHTNVSHLSYIGDATLGEKVNIGAGTITANYDHLTKKKQRTIVGDGSSTGSNSVLVAPIIVGNDSVVAAGSVCNRDVPDGALAVARPKQQNIINWVKRKLSQSGDKKE